MHFYTTTNVFHQSQVSIGTIWSVLVQVDQQLTSGHRHGYYQALLPCGSTDQIDVYENSWTAHECSPS